jgi:HEAT repeat protein
VISLDKKSNFPQGGLKMTRLVPVLILLAVVGAGFADGAAAQKSFQDELANLTSPNAGTRQKAAKELGRSGRLEAIPPLNEAVRDSEAKVRREVVKALAGFKRPETIDGLLVGLRDEEKDIRTAALLGLIDIYVDPDDRRPIQKFLSMFSDNEPRPQIEPVGQVEGRVIIGLEQRLKDEEASIRQKAAFGLGLLRAQEAVASIASLLSDPSQPVRREAVAALERLGGDQAGQALMSALRDPSRDIQAQAVEALGKVGYQPAAQELLNLYQAQEGKAMGDKALASLSQMGAREARGVFLQQMTSSNSNRRRWAVEGLGRYADEGLKRGLTKDFLREPDPSVQLAYCFALALVGRPEFIDRIALSLSKPPLRPQSIGYLVELGSPFLTELVTYLTDPVPAVRKDMAFVLMEIGDPDAIPYLKPLLGDSDASVADWANRAISRLERVKVTDAVNPSM